MTDLPLQTETHKLLSPKALDVLAAAGPDAYARLVVRGGGTAEGKQLLSSLNADDLLVRPAAESDAPFALMAGLWLWHDWLDESHTFSQAISGVTGSFWHAIMHRREGDFGNAKYWYARCMNHPAQARISELAQPILDNPQYAGQAARLKKGGWDAYAWVDLAEQAESRPAGDPLRELAVSLQRLEWQVLFEDTAKSAAG